MSYRESFLDPVADETDDMIAMPGIITSLRRTTSSELRGRSWNHLNSFHHRTPRYEVIKFCTVCNIESSMIERTSVSCESWVICGGLWLVGCWFGGCLLPFMDSAYWKTRYYCENCRRRVVEE